MDEQKSTNVPESVLSFLRANSTRGYRAIELENLLQLDLIVVKNVVEAFVDDGVVKRKIERGKLGTEVYYYYAG